MTLKPVFKTEDDSDVDTIVEAVAADPSRAEDAKKLLRQKLAAPTTVRVIVPERASKEAARIEDDIDDLWDNVPV